MDEVLKFPLKKNKEMDFSIGIDCVISIDFGTMRTGYGFCHKEYQNGLIFVEGNYRGLKDYKNHTAILYDNNGEPISWGKNAMDLAQTKKDSYLLSDFKMELTKKEDYNQYTDDECPFRIYKTVNKRKFNVVVVISDLLKMVKTDAVTKLERLIDKKIDIDKTRIIVTVPAIWSDKMKGIMIWACNKAGIGPKIFKNFSFALEPECGILSVFKTNTINSGCGVLVVDLGGGTVDITSFMKNNSNKFEQITPPNGAAAGGRYVDEEFFNWSFQKNTFNNENLYILEKSAPYQRFVTHWNQAKESFEGENETQIDNVDDFKEELEKYNIVLNGFENGDLVISAQQMKKFFGKSINLIVQKTNEELQKASKIKKIEKVALVGGYGNSEYVRKELKKKLFQNVTNVIGIDKSGEAILYGSLMFGKNNEVIEKRIINHTFGISCKIPFIEGKHPEKKKIFDDGEAYCGNVFSLLTKGNISWKPNEPVKTNMAIPQGKNKTGCIIRLYYTNPEKVPEYVDECKELASITVEPMFYYDSNGKLKKGKTIIDINISLYFADTFLKMEVEILDNKWTVDASWPSESGFY